VNDTFWAHARKAGHAVLDLLLPRTCLCCDAQLDVADDELVCRVCVGRLARLPAPRCERCGHPVTKYACRWCDFLPPYVRAVRSVCWVPDGVAGDLVHKFKYDGWTSLGRLFAGRMARLPYPRDVVEERSCLVPVPLAAGRLRERGYNQSTLLADELARAWEIPRLDALARTRATETQTRLTPSDRLRNVAGAFGAVVPKRELAGKHVVLVDDVVTTAATLNACAAALHLSGARIVSYVTFGRARGAGDAP
jgi:ComF family protein